MRVSTMLVGAVLAALAASASATLPNPVMFVTQVPVPGDDVAARTVTSSFANHLGSTAAAPRGGDLMLLAPSGTLRNLTAEAGYGSTGAGGFQDANAIAVRDPTVHWSGTKAVFSMVVGAPATAGANATYLWQLYEVTNFGAGQTATIAKVANQPPYNNIEPAYLSDGTLVFVSDRPRNGAPQLYPINDEYRGQEANSGLWRLDPSNGALTLLEHTPSGSFHPIVDQAGRLLFTRWDHLMQDNNNNPLNPTPQYTVFDWTSEAANASTATAVDLYPEPINEPAGSPINPFEINQFFPWQVNQDGTREEILNHLGRHELSVGINKTFANDSNLVVFNAATSGRTNPNAIYNCHQMREDPRPAKAGRILCVDSQEFGTHVSGQIVAINAPLGANAHDITVQYITNRATALPFTASGNIGHFRDPLPLSDGSLVAAFSPTPLAEPGPAGAPATYQFRLTSLSANDTANGNAINSGTLTGGAGISKSVSYYANGTLVSYSGALWEIEPVEVAARSAPTAQTEPALAAPEQAAFATANVAEADIRAFLKTQGLALLVMRNVTSRDAADQQQPYNLHVAVTGGTQTLGNANQLYDISEMQFFESDQVRGFGTPAAPLPGRRTLTRYLNDAHAVRFNPNAATNPGAQPIAADGSVALFVPAQRAMTWTTLAPASSPNNPAWVAANAPVVRERYWIEYQPGEIRACDGCHGVNVTNQAGLPAATNTPQALIDLLAWWKLHDDEIFYDGYGP